MIFRKAIITLLVIIFLLPQSSCKQSRHKETFAIGEETFLLNNEPFVIKAAEIHIHAHRLKN